MRDLIDTLTEELALEQEQELGRVSDRLSYHVHSFCKQYIGQCFHSDELRRYVDRRVHGAAPGSADRILRMLRQQGTIDYEVVNRAKSQYRVNRA